MFDDPARYVRYPSANAIELDRGVVEFWHRPNIAADAADDSTNVLLVTLLIPVTAILLGAAFLGERLHLLHFAGMAVIGIGLLVIDGRIWGLIARRTRV